MDYARLSVKVIHEDESFEEVRKSGTLSVNDDKEGDGLYYNHDLNH